MSHSTNDVLQKISDPEDAEKARSLLDLIELNTVDLELAAWLVSLVSRGASYITGSGPGGIVNKIFYTDGSGPHQSVYEPVSGLTPTAPRDPDYETRCRAFLTAGLASPERSIAGVRRHFLEWNA